MWDADSAEEGDKEDGENVPKAIQRKKKKKLADIIAEKEAAEAAKTEARRLLKEAEREASTPAGKAAEKARLQKIEENANLQLAKDMLGLTVGSSVDKIVPVSKEDFDQLEKAIVDKVSSCNSSKDLTLFSDFVESLIKNLCLDLQAPALKKVKIHVEALHATRLKEEKANKAKKSKKGGQLRMDTTKVCVDNPNVMGVCRCRNWLIIRYFIFYL